MKNLRREAERWLTQAEYDLKTARWNFQGKFFAPACFWAQQCAEKALKAFLYFKGERLVIGHSVAALINKGLKYSKEIKKLSSYGGLLDRYYIPTRYPNSLPDGIPAYSYTEKDSREALRLCEKVLDFVRKAMGKRE